MVRASSVVALHATSGQAAVSVADLAARRAETVYRQEIRPALTRSATAMDKIFSEKPRTA
jgi:hypothetical protein